MQMQECGNDQTVLVTGAAGFIGYHLAARLIASGKRVVGFDNINDYYDVSLKHSRLKNLERYDEFTFIKGDLTDRAVLHALFKECAPSVVINLAAQAGVRYSIECPEAYVDSNVTGFFNILEECRHNKIEHLLFASSSSVYGNQKKTPFAVSDKTDTPISLYAATKKTNELMAYTYSHLYKIPCTGLRFFTVYGPYGRPDMAYFSFTKKIYAGQTIKVFNNGDLYRDFTYIDDIVAGIAGLLPVTPEPDENGVCYKVYNIGNNKPEKLTYFIRVLEEAIGIEAKKEFLPMQPGDVYQTYADITDLMKVTAFKPQTSIEEGISKFIEWYKDYYLV